MAMNLTQPPFDDVHVRRAMTWIMDKAAVRDAWGGAMAGRIAQHVVPDGVLANQLQGYAPFKTRGDHGDLARARIEMAKSKYTTRNGVCIAKACKRVHLGSGPAGPSGYAPGERMKRTIMETAAKLGITFILRASKPDRPSSNNPFSSERRVVEARPGPVELLRPTAHRRNHPPERQPQLLARRDQARAGAQARREGPRHGRAERRRRHRAVQRAHRRGARRLLRELDRKLSTEVVAWIPFLWRNRITILGRQVASWAFDQSAGTTAYAHVAVKR